MERCGDQSIAFEADKQLGMSGSDVTKTTYVTSNLILKTKLLNIRMDSQM